jgi:hypothetical protein
MKALPEVLREADDGSRRYAHKGYEFTVVKGGLMWWCHNGASIPGELIGIEHEAGWGSFTHRAVVRKITRAIRSTERRHLRDKELAA